ncbi:MAG: YoaK family protein [Treponema sp.]
MKIGNLFVKIWVIALTFLAGYLNGGFFNFFDITVSHHSGSVTKLVNAAASAHTAPVLLYIPIAFFFGAFISGLVFNNRHLQLHYRYGIMVMAFAGVFFIIGFFKLPFTVSALLTCMILGIQNGMFIFYNDTIVRTTHLTGYITDAAVSLSRFIRREKNAFQKCAFYTGSIFCFAAGVYCAAFIPYHAFFYSAAFLYFITGLTYFIFRNLSRKKNYSKAPV